MNLLSKIRSELGQLSYSFKRRNTPKLWRDQVEAIRFLKVHNLPAPRLKGPRQEVWAVSVVKNELDILPSVLDHFFAQGIDRIIVADNLSTDGTCVSEQTRIRDLSLLKITATDIFSLRR